MALAVCVGLLVVGRPAVAETVHVKLDFVRLEASDQWPYSDCGCSIPSTYRNSRTGLVVPEEGEKQPEARSAPQGLSGWAAKALGVSGRDLRFGTLPVEGSEGGYAFALERRPDSEGYIALCIDINEDGIIGAGERFVAVPVVKAPRERHPGPVSTPVVSIFTFEMPFVRATGTSADYAFQVRVMAEKERKDGLEVAFIPLGYRKGRIVIDGTPYSVMLIDQTMNGRFNDFAECKEDYWDGDRVVFVPEQDKETDLIAEKEPLNNIRMLGEKPCRVSVSADGAEMTLTPADLPCGQLKMQPAAEGVFLACELGPFYVRHSETAILPAGNYRLINISYAAMTKDGVAWRMSGYSFSGQTLPKFEVKPNKTVKMPFGAPFNSRVVKKSLAGKGSLTMKVELAGQAGERYEYGCTAPDGKCLPTADVVLKTKNGKEIARVKRSLQDSADEVLSDYSWEGFFPQEGLMAECDLGLPWKVKAEKAFLNADRK